MLRVTSSLSRDTSAPAAGHALGRRRGGRRASTDAGLDRRPGRPPDVRPGGRAHAGRTGPGRVRGDPDLAPTPADPVAYTTYVDARDGGVLVREDLVDFDSDNPRWAVFPATPPTRSGRAPTRGCIWCLDAGARLRAHRAATRTAARPGTSNLATGTPTLHLVGQLGQRRGAAGPAAPRPPRPRPARTATTSTRSPTSGTRPAATRPAFTSAQRNDADAAVTQPVRHAQPHARLGLPARLHRGGLEPAGGQPRARPGLGGDAEQGRAQAGALERQPQQRQPGHAARRPAADHEHVPVAAGGRRRVPAVRRRRLRHDRDRPRVHPRDHQPDDRRPGRRDRRRSRAARWARPGAT